MLLHTDTSGIHTETSSWKCHKGMSHVQSCRHQQICISVNILCMYFFGWYNYDHACTNVILFVVLCTNLLTCTINISEFFLLHITSVISLNGTERVTMYIYFNKEGSKHGDYFLFLNTDSSSNKKHLYHALHLYSMHQNQAYGSGSSNGK